MYYKYFIYGSFKFYWIGPKRAVAIRLTICWNENSKFIYFRIVSIEILSDSIVPNPGLDFAEFRPQFYK